jgi:hypothetical protein
LSRGDTYPENHLLGTDVQRRLSLSALFAMAIAVALPSTSRAQVAPQGLRGKSVIVTWTELRNQRRGDQTAFNDVVAPLSRTIYVGSTGRPFSRFTGQLRGRTASFEHVGATGTSSGGGPSEVRFDGRTMTLIGSSKGGLARRITIEFSESFTTCQAKVVFAKEAGKDVVVGRSLVSGERLDIRSVTVTGVSCSVRDVFAQ